MEVVLIRHARPEIMPGVCYGRVDIPLASPISPLPAMIVEGLPLPHRIVASPARRARDTAAALTSCLAGAPDIDLDANLREMDFGDWEGQAWDAIPRDALDLWAADLMGARPHGGESAMQVMTRVTAWADALDVEADRRIWAVTHAGPMRMLAAHWLGLPLAQTLQWSLAFGASCGFRVGEGPARMLWWNRKTG